MRVSSVLDIGNDCTTLEGIARPASAGLAAAGAVALAAAFAVARMRAGWTMPSMLTWPTTVSGRASRWDRFFVGMLHVTRAGWGVVVRRLAEILGCNFTVLAFLFLPVLLGSGTLYEWANPSLVHADEALRHKAPYLNFTFFGVRIIAYFVVWWLISRFYLERSSGQDSSGDPNVTVGMERWSGPSLLLLSVTATYASFDWIMSLHPHWASTIFGVYYFSGAMVGRAGRVDPRGRRLAGFRAASHRDQRRTLPRSGKTSLGVRYFLGIYCLFPIHVDLVCQHPGRDRLVRAPPLWPLGLGGVGVVVRAFDRPVPGAHVTRSQAAPRAAGILGRMASLLPLARPAVAGDAPHEFPATSIRRN